jgi:hypothetical protein
LDKKGLFEPQKTKKVKKIKNFQNRHQHFGVLNRFTGRIRNKSIKLNRSYLTVLHGVVFKNLEQCFTKTEKCDIFRIRELRK